MLSRTLIQATVAIALAAPAVHAADITLLNASYDPTRELYQEVGKAFAAQWKARTGDDVTVTIGSNGRPHRYATRKAHKTTAHAP